MITSKRVFISADHGLAIIYFLQSDLVSTLLDAGLEIILLTDDALVDSINDRFGRPGLVIEGLRVDLAEAYFKKEHNSIQWWLDFLRRAGASRRINLEAVNGFVNQVEDISAGRRRRLFPLMKSLLWGLRQSKFARSQLIRSQKIFTPRIYADLFNRYRPRLVIASTPGWRFDRYLLREAAQHGIPTGAVIVGWDNTSSYSLPGAPVNWISCWSQVQKQELILGADWNPERVNIGGIPSYDGYFRRQWLIPRPDYFQQHNLDPERKLISYACSFITFSPNIQNVEALASLVASDALVEPSQLLVRLHPNHFTSEARFIAERERIRKMARELPHVHVVEPVPLGGRLGYYSGEDMPEKSSMMAYSDVFTTVYSTMVVEACTHGVPVVSICIDSPSGWPDNYTLPLSEIGNWPTHARFRDSGAGRVAMDPEELKHALNHYLSNPAADNQARQTFIANECTYSDGRAGRRTAEYFLSLIPRFEQDRAG